MVEQQVRLLAETYSQQARMAVRHAVAAEPEAQLTVPISNLFTRACEIFDVGSLTMIREAQLDGVHPDGQPGDSCHPPITPATPATRRSVGCE